MDTDPVSHTPAVPTLSPERAAERARIERRLRDGAPRPVIQARTARRRDLRQWVAASATALFLVIGGGLYATQPSGTSTASSAPAAAATSTATSTPTASASTSANTATASNASYTAPSTHSS